MGSPTTHETPASPRRPFIACPGPGGSASRSLYLGLKALGFEKVDHFSQVSHILSTAPEDDAFDWRGVVTDRFNAVLDTPIPAFWRELVEAHGGSDDAAAAAAAKVVLTVRRDYSRDYASRFDLGDAGVANADWELARRARIGMGLTGGPDTAASSTVAETPPPPRLRAWAKASSMPSERALGELFPETHWGSGAGVEDERCHSSKATCRDDCGQYLRLTTTSAADRRAALAALSAVGDAHCRIAGIDPPIDVVDDLVRRPARAVLEQRAADAENRTADKDVVTQKRYKSRVSVYGTACPSAMTTLKAYFNTNRHILRTIPPDRLLVMDITRGDGYELLCPFLEIPADACPPPGTPFPNGEHPLLATTTPIKKPTETSDEEEEEDPPDPSDALDEDTEGSLTNGRLLRGLEATTARERRQDPSKTCCRRMVAAVNGDSSSIPRL